MFYTERSLNSEQLLRCDSVIYLVHLQMVWFVCSLAQFCRRLIVDRQKYPGYHIAIQWKLTFYKLNAVMLLPQSICVPMHLDCTDCLGHFILSRFLFSSNSRTQWRFVTRAFPSRFDQLVTSVQSISFHLCRCTLEQSLNRSESSQKSFLSMNMPFQNAYAF